MIKICLAAKENINVDTAPTTVISIHFNTQYNAIANKTNMLFSLAEPGIWKKERTIYEMHYMTNLKGFGFTICAFQH